MEEFPLDVDEPEADGPEDGTISDRKCVYFLRNFPLRLIVTEYGQDQEIHSMTLRELGHVLDRQFDISKCDFVQCAIAKNLVPVEGCSLLFRRDFFEDKLKMSDLSFYHRSFSPSLVNVQGRDGNVPDQLRAPPDAGYAASSFQAYSLTKRVIRPRKEDEPFYDAVLTAGISIPNEILAPERTALESRVITSMETLRSFSVAASRVGQLMENPNGVRLEVYYDFERIEDASFTGFLQDRFRDAMDLIDLTQSQCLGHDLKDALRCFPLRIFPGIQLSLMSLFKWGIVTPLVENWIDCKLISDSAKELMSISERLLQFLFSGRPQVLPMRILRSTGVALNLDRGFPRLGNEAFDLQTFSISYSKWPVENGAPALSYLASVRLVLGERSVRNEESLVLLHNSLSSFVGGRLIGKVGGYEFTNEIRGRFVSFMKWFHMNYFIPDYENLAMLLIESRLRGVMEEIGALSGHMPNDGNEEIRDMRSVQRRLSEILSTAKVTRRSLVPDVSTIRGDMKSIFVGELSSEFTRVIIPSGELHSLQILQEMRQQLEVPRSKQILFGRMEWPRMWSTVYSQMMNRFAVIKTMLTSAFIEAFDELKPDFWFDFGSRHWKERIVRVDWRRRIEIPVEISSTGQGSVAQLAPVILDPFELGEVAFVNALNPTRLHLDSFQKVNAELKAICPKHSLCPVAIMRFWNGMPLNERVVVLTKGLIFARDPFKLNENLKRTGSTNLPANKNKIAAAFLLHYIGIRCGQKDITNLFLAKSGKGLQHLAVPSTILYVMDLITGERKGRGFCNPKANPIDFFPSMPRLDEMFHQTRATYLMEMGPAS